MKFNYKTIYFAGLALAAAVGQALLASASEHEGLNPRLHVPRAFELKQIMVDGDLRDRSWEQGTMTYSFVSENGAAAPDAFTRARIIHDYHGIYVGYTAFMKGEGAMEDDIVGLVLSYPGDGGKMHSLQVELSGDNSVKVSSGGDALLVAGLQTAVKPGDNLWDAEIFIPYDSMGAAMPGNGDIWKAAFYRKRPVEGLDTEFSSWLPGNGAGELRFGSDLLVYLYSKRPFYAPDEIMVYNFSDKLRRLQGTYVDAGGDEVMDVTVHLGPGHRRQHYRMDGVKRGMYYVVVTDRDALPGQDDVLMVMPRPQFGN